MLRLSTKGFERIVVVSRGTTVYLDVLQPHLVFPYSYSFDNFIAFESMQLSFLQEQNISQLTIYLLFSQTSRSALNHFCTHFILFEDSFGNHFSYFAQFLSRPFLPGQQQQALTTFKKRKHRSIIKHVSSFVEYRLHLHSPR